MLLCSAYPSVACIRDCLCRWCHLDHPDPEHNATQDHAPYGYCVARNETCAGPYSATCLMLDNGEQSYFYYFVISIVSAALILGSGFVLWTVVSRAYAEFPEKTDNEEEFADKEYGNLMIVDDVGTPEDLIEPFEDL